MTTTPLEPADGDQIVTADPLDDALIALRASHDYRFDCNDYEPTVVDDDGENVVVCKSCRFVVARLPEDEEVDGDE